MLFGRLIQQAHFIVFVHRKDVVEAFEIDVADSTSKYLSQRNTAALGSCRRTTIGRLTDVIGVRAGRINFYLVCSARFVDEVPEYAFRSR